MALPNSLIKAVPLSRPSELLAAIDSVATTLYVADDAVGRDTDGNLIAPIRLVFGIGQGAEEVYCPTAPVDRHYEGVTRGAGGTLARAWPKGTPVARRFSGTDWDGMIGNLDNLDGRVETLEAAAPGAVAFGDLSDVTITTPSLGDVIVHDGSGWVNGAATGGTTTAQVTPDAIIIAHATTDAVAGKTGSIDLTANHGQITRVRFRADFTAGQQVAWSGLVDQANGYDHDDTSVAFDGAVGTLTAGDYVRWGEEICLVGGSGTIAMGAALYKRVNHKKGVAIANIGDGSLGRGPVLEALNMSGMGQLTELWRDDMKGGLPVIFTILRRYAEHMTSTAEGKMRNLILAVEEPELYMHPQAQRTIRQVFRKIAEGGGSDNLFDSFIPAC